MTDITTAAPVAPPEHTGEPDTTRKPRPQGSRRTHTTKPRQEARPPREVNPVLEKLFELHPKLFGANFLPLKLGIFQELLARHPDAFKKDELKLAMGQHARSTRYLESVAAGHQRHDLDGNPVEPVSPEHVHHAILEVFRRRQARSKEDLRPRLVARIVDAIEASGLPREEYAERVRVQDESANALVDEALSQLKLEAAKRDALMATFKASGKTEAEFAEMYGMNPAEVSSVLERVRRDQSSGV
ncbi:MAG: ProQ/FINO family protein [Pseudomonadota bacterium]